MFHQWTKILCFLTPTWVLTWLSVSTVELKIQWNQSTFFHGPIGLFLPAASGPANKTLVVNNLAFSATEEVLQSTFEKAVSIRIPQRDGRPKGWVSWVASFLQKTQHSFSWAPLNLYHDYVRIRTRSRASEHWQLSSSCVWVLHVSAVRHVEMLTQESSDQVSNASLTTLFFFFLLFSFAFVEFESTEDAKEALENLNNTDIEGRSIRLEYSQNSSRGEGGRGNSGTSSNLSNLKVNIV